MSEFYNYQLATTMHGWHIEHIFYPPLTDTEFAFLVAAWHKAWGSSFYRLYLHRPVSNEDRHNGRQDLYLIREWNTPGEHISDREDDLKMPREHYFRAHDFIVGFVAGLRIRQNLTEKKEK